MLRTTFPSENIAWKKEVERMLSTLTVGQRNLAQQAAPILSSGVVVGGVVPDPKQCMQFEFTVNGPQATDCRGCVSDCKTVHIASDITGIRAGLGESTPTVIIPAGDYVLTRIGSANDCMWRYGELATTMQITFASPGGSTDGTGQTTSIGIQSHGMIGSMVYYNEVVFSDWNCDSVPYKAKDDNWVDHPDTITITSGDCADEGDTPADCTDGVKIKAEIKWEEASYQWVQSYFSVNGTEGGGSIEPTFSGATFSLRFQFTSSFCADAADATYHAPVYVDDRCRTVTGRRAGYAPGWPSTITGQCVDCTPHTTTSTSSTSTESTTTSSTTESTTTGSTTSTESTTTGSTTTASTTGSTTESTTTGSTTTASTTGSTTESTTTGSTTESTTTGSTTSTESTTTGSTTESTTGSTTASTTGSSTDSSTDSSTTSTTSTTTVGPCTGSCRYTTVADGTSPTGYQWSYTSEGSDCSASCGACPTVDFAFNSAHSYPLAPDQLLVLDCS